MCLLNKYRFKSLYNFGVTYLRDRLLAVGKECPRCITTCTYDSGINIWRVNSLYALCVILYNILSSKASSAIFHLFIFFIYIVLTQFFFYVLLIHIFLQSLFSLTSYIHVHIATLLIPSNSSPFYFLLFLISPIFAHLYLVSGLNWY